jgi:haloacetate dehalogenase
MTAIENVQSIYVDTDEATIFVKKSGSGPASLLLHGFPQTHLMWRDIVPLLEPNFTVICADLRGYGKSSCPDSDANHYAYSKRAMAIDMVKVMGRLGFNKFSVIGHDRGGRVAYRLALDHPERVSSLTVLDIVPIMEALDRADRRLAETFWPWSLLSQPSPLPEKLILGAPDAIIANALSSWGSKQSSFSAEIREAYTIAISDPKHVHAICEEFRTACSIDYDHDKESLRNNQRITCPVLVIWAKGGALDTWYKSSGGPLALWKYWADQVAGEAVEGGHFFPEEEAELTAGIIKAVLTGDTYPNEPQT